MCRARLTCVALAVLLVSTAATGIAQADKDGKEPSAEVRKKASDHVEKGRILQEQGNYAEAIKQYRAAYRLIPHPQLLYNIGQAYRLKGDKRRAIKLYEEYLGRAPKGETATLARGFIRELTDELARETPPDKDEDKDKNDESDVDKRDNQSDDELEVADPGRSKRRTGVLIMALGAVGLGVGTGFAIQAASINKEFDGAVWDPDKQGRYDQGRSAQLYGYLGLGIGAATVTAGAVLYFLNRRPSSPGGNEDSVSFGASASGSQANVWLRGRF